MNPADVTFVVLTRNEARNIVDCLRSLPAGSPALVYDAQSTDATCSLAALQGARVVGAPWAGYATARAAAAALVSTPWTFMLDADERLSPGLGRELLALDAPAGIAAYSVARRNHFCGRWIRGAGWWPDRLVRLFRTGCAGLAARGNSKHAVHERWIANGAVAQLAAPLEHYSYPSLHTYREKFARYSDLEAAGARPSLAAAIGAWLLAPARAAWLLVGRRGVLDGWQGAYVSVASALYPAVVAAKSLRRRMRGS